MRIRGWHVDGFGIHRDYRVDDLSRGLTVFYGPNESGKSTLLAFLRGVLFGYPDGRSSDPKYPPLGGGAAHGGRITLESAAGCCVVERFAGRGGAFRMTLEDGRAGTAADLAARLGHADARLFRSIHAFGLSELQELGSLGQAGIQDQLFSAGVTGAGRSARQAGRELTAAARELFAGERSRKSDRVAPLQRELGLIEADLALRQETALRHPDLSSRERALASRLVELEHVADDRRADERRARRLLELWHEACCPLADLREQSAKLSSSEPDRLPADAGARLEDALARIERAQERLEAVRAERTALDRQHEGLRLDEAARLVARQVSALNEQLSLYRRQCARRTELESLRRESRTRVRAALERLGCELSEDALRVLRPTAARRAELREWKRGFDEGRARSAELAATQRLEREQRERLESRLHDLEQRLAGQPRGERTSAVAAAVALGELRTLVLRERAAEGRASWTRSLTIALAGVALALSALAGWLVAGIEGAGGGFALLALVLLGGVVLVRRSGRQRARRLAALRAEAVEPIVRLGLSGAALCAETLALAERTLERIRGDEAGEARLRDGIAEARAQLEELEALLRATHLREQGDLDERAALERGFARFCEEAGVPAGFSVEAAAEFFEEVRRGQDALEEDDRLAVEATRLEAEVRAWEQGVDALLADCPPPPRAADEQAPPSDAPRRIEALARLRERCESDRAAREGRKPLEQRAVELREQFRVCESALSESRAQLAALLEETGARDPEALQRRIADREAALDLAAQIARAAADLARRLDASGPEEAERLRTELSRGCVDEWEASAREARADATRLGAERDEVLREHQDAARARKRLEESTEVMELELRRTAVLQELREVVGEWLRLRLAGSLVGTALERFEARHQPGVFREASLLFERVTDGRYPRIVQSDERAGFSVIGADGLNLSAEDLSRGTAEQLYLCIRLGLIAELSRTREPLPVVMDDVLVNFDDARAAAMARVLGAFAAGNQLLFFTCSARTRDLLASTGPQAGQDVQVRSLEPLPA
jgi:uncharacterized protein YhaN